MPYYAPAEQAADFVPYADLLVITGVTILNDTLPGLLAMAKPGAEILVTGPTASMLPEPLFAKEVAMTGGIIVTKAGELLDIISEGGFGISLLWQICGTFGNQTQEVIIKKQNKQNNTPVDN